MVFLRVSTIVVRSLMATLFVLTVFLSGRAQPNPSSPVAYLKADSLRHSAHYDSSNTYYNKAIRKFEANQAWQKKVEALYKISLNKFDQDKLKESLQLLDEALALYYKYELDHTPFLLKAYHHKGILAEYRADYQEALRWHRKGLDLANRTDGNKSLEIRLITGIGEVYNTEGKYKEAIAQFRKAEELYHRNRINDKRLLSRIYNSYGMCHQDNGYWNNALTYYRQSLEIDQEILPPRHPSLAKSHNNIAIVYYYQSDYQRALEYMENAVSVLSDFYGANHRLVAASYNNVGIVYSEINELDKATEYLEKALDIKKELLGKDHPDIAIGYQNLGTIYYDMEQYDQAIAYYKKAEALYLKNFPEGHPERADVYANLGQAYAQKKVYEKAIDYYHKDLDINRQLLEASHPFIGDTYMKIGETHAMADNYEQALDYFQRAIAIFISGTGPETVPQDLSTEKIIYPTQLLETLRLKADVLQKQADQNQDLQLLEQSLRTYLQATQLIDELQKSYSREGSKLLLRERSLDIYQKGFATAYQLFKKTGSSEYKEYAFYLAEKSTGQILLEQLKSIDARTYAGVPDSLISREHKLRSHLTDLQQRLSGLVESPQQSDSLQHVALQDSTFQARQTLVNHIQKLEQNYPKYYELKYRPLVVRTSDVKQQILSPGQTLIRFFFGPEALYAFVISEETFKLQKLSANSSLQQNIVSYQQNMRAISSAEQFSADSYHLYAELFQPLSDYIAGRQIIVIPDGVLHYLPFESLVAHNTADADTRFHQLPYLIHDYDISYAPSASYLHLNHQLKTDKKQELFLGFAPVFSNRADFPNIKPYSDSDQTLTSLLLSKQEVEKLGSLFENDGGFLNTNQSQAELYLDDSATENRFKNLSLANYQYIHLATHAFVSEENPEQSAILFANSQQQEDGVLYAAEIYNLQLNARLVTLSACKTGTGAFAKGEGIMSLSRAFQYAGAQNLLVSLWNVNDRPTSRLMVDFYKQHHQKATMTRALQKAKRAMIEKVEYAHPKHWASFVLIGQ